MTDELKPKDVAEQVALFRAQVLGPLLCRGVLDHGDVAAELRALSDEYVRPPDSPRTRTYSVPTLQRWYYAYRRGGLDALRPKRRSDAGHARGLTDEERLLLLAIRHEHPTVSVALIHRTLIADGRLEPGRVSMSTLRRLYRQHGLERTVRRVGGARMRLRWETAAPNQIWHADVCHGPALRVNGVSVPLRIHAILDDHSRYVVALEACSTEREAEMLRLSVKAFRLHGTPETFYLDNGPTYVGDTLRVACGRLGVGLVHAEPHDPQARGKMERFWRTLREQCLDHLGVASSLHDVQVRLLAWLDRHYHVTPHSSLMGRCPAEVYEAASNEPVSETMLREALTVRATRRVRKDCTLSVAGTDFEVDASYLAGRIVTLARVLLDPSTPPWIEHEDQRLALRPVDPRANAKRSRKTSKRAARGIDAVPFAPVPFDPNGARLDALVGGAR
jgi:transposase InsO family protein